MDLRSTADYGGPVRMDRETATEALGIAEKTIQAINREFPDRFEMSSIQLA